ncbi:MAG: DUF1902 domain-containing protein [Defluviitaleaceae bacterium]|nr:DUF1902 domain-containing protein [Defluviitaleaceae bacterium]MCL2275746.1 DUF1902 domain-containing protein [Defluviitaleaceae bacterium]
MTSEDDDISGFVLEYDTFQGLVDEVKLCIPVLLECQQMVRDNVSLDFVAHS